MRTSQKRKKLHGGLNFLNTEENNQQKNVIINKRTLLPTHTDTHWLRRVKGRNYCDVTPKIAKLNSVFFFLKWLNWINKVFPRLWKWITQFCSFKIYVAVLSNSDVFIGVESRIVSNFQSKEVGTLISCSLR